MIINGTAKWAKVVGPAQPAYDKTKREWSIDLYITDETAKKLEAEGLGPKVKDKGEGKYIQFKKGDTLKDGTAAKPIRIVDRQGNKLDNPPKIGNGSKVNVSFVVNERTYNGKKFLKPGIIAIQIVDLVEYESGEKEDFPTYNEAGEAEDWSDADAA